MKDAEDAKKNDQLPQENRKSHACNVVVRLLMGMLRMRLGGVGGFCSYKLRNLMDDICP